jgi:hypothetical protein
MVSIIYIVDIHPPLLALLWLLGFLRPMCVQLLHPETLPGLLQWQSTWPPSLPSLSHTHLTPSPPPFSAVCGYERHTRTGYGQGRDAGTHLTGGSVGALVLSLPGPDECTSGGRTMDHSSVMMVCCIQRMCASAVRIVSIEPPLRQMPESSSRHGPVGGHMLVRGGAILHVLAMT